MAKNESSSISIFFIFVFFVLTTFNKVLVFQYFGQKATLVITAYEAASQRARKIH